MHIILTKDVDNLGHKNEVVRVKDGFARNFLLPRNMAIPATPGNLQSRSKKIEQAQKDREARVSEAQEVSTKLHGKTFVILAKAGKEGKLYGSVTPQDIQGAIFAFTGIEVDKRRIHLSEPIRALGLYTVNVKLTQGVSAALRIDVHADGEEGEEVLVETPEGEGVLSEVEVEITHEHQG